MTSETSPGPAAEAAFAENVGPPGSRQKPTDALAIATIRTLAIDAVQQANSGHPGTPMALAPVAYTLWQRFLRFDPADPSWPARDRFVLSNGHASMLLYALLHLAGTVDAEGEPAVSLEDIKSFRQLGSKCPGHPEYRRTAGVETTTGPLGQGCGNSVGMAIAGRWLAERYNRPSFQLFDYDIYTFCSDGDMMEGIASEAASLAGHLQLGNLCWIYDRNSISIEGSTALAFTEDVPERFRAYGWRVTTVQDANDLAEIARAFESFLRKDGRPMLIVVESHIGYGAPNKHDTAAAHGEALGEEEVRLAKRNYGWPEDAKFLVPPEVYQHFRTGIGERGRTVHAGWCRLLEDYRANHAELAAELDLIWHGELPPGLEAALPRFDTDAKGMAGREASGKALNALAPLYPSLLGGSADLSPSTRTTLKDGDAGELEAGTPGGRNMHFGVREHAMGAILNGLAVSGLRPFGASFLIFTDYMKPAIRLAALMELPTIYIMTHDSIGLGEDGPTHQPIEQLIGLRAIPGLIVLRPGDANEVAEAWRTVLSLRREPACLVLSRQPVPTIDRGRYAPAAGAARGAYTLADEAEPQLILIGTGSEVQICLEAHQRLREEGIAARVVSMPSWELFDRQDAAYRESVLPHAITARVAVEAASTMGWSRYIGNDGEVIGMHGFGASAPIKVLYRHFGITAEHVVEAARRQIAAVKERRT